MLNKWHIVTICFLVLLIVASSCRKDENLSAEAINPVAEARLFFESKSKTDQLVATGRSFLPDKILPDRSADWSSAFSQQQGDTVSVFVPLQLPFTVRLTGGDMANTTLNNFIMLRMTRHGNNSPFTTEMLTLIPDQPWLDGQPFSGSVIAEDWFRPVSRYFSTRPAGKTQPLLQNNMPEHTGDIQAYASGCVSYQVCVGDVNMISLLPQQNRIMSTDMRPQASSSHTNEMCYSNSYCPPGQGGVSDGFGDIPYNPPPLGGGNGSSGGNSGGLSDAPPLSPPSEVALLDQLEDKPFALFGDVPCDIIKAWLATASHQVGQTQINKLNNIVQTTTMRPGITTTTVARLQDINNAYSAVVNMDYFPVTINQLPVVNGQRLTAAQFLNYIRKDINSFINTTYTKFTPYQWYGVNETNLWNSSNPLGAVVALDIAGPDNGSVIVSHFSSNKWTFSTIFDPKYGMHPVSGHRDFGYTQNADGSYTFYTRGVDRLADMGGTSLQAITEFLFGNGVPFASADALWGSFVDKIREFVNQNGGSASRAFVRTERPDWQKVKDVLDGKAPLSTLSKDCPD